jgi:hypothetical protein
MTHLLVAQVEKLWSLSFKLIDPGGVEKTNSKSLRGRHRYDACLEISRGELRVQNLRSLARLWQLTADPWEGCCFIAVIAS